MSTETELGGRGLQPHGGDSICFCLNVQFYCRLQHLLQGHILQCTRVSFPLLFPPGSVYRDEFDLAILKLQEDNRLEILKRKWWDGGKCPKEEDHRAKGPSLIGPHLVPVLKLHSAHVSNNTLSVFIFPSSTNPSSHHLSPSRSHAWHSTFRPSRSGNGEHRGHLRGAGVWPAGGYLHGSAGVCLDVKADARKWGERGLSNLLLLSLPLPCLVTTHTPPPHPLLTSWWTFKQCTALTGSVAGVSFFLWAPQSTCTHTV